MSFLYRVWWHVTHVFSSPDAIAAEEKQRLTSLASTLGYEIDSKSRTSRWTYAKAGELMDSGDETGSRDLLMAYAQELMVIHQLRDYKTRLETHAAKLTGLNIQFHMLNAYERLTWATDKWSRGADMDSRLDSLDKMAETLDDMHEVLQVGDATLETHTANVENARPMVEQSLDDKVKDMFARLKEERKDRALESTPSVASHRRPRGKKVLGSAHI